MNFRMNPQGTIEIDDVSYPSVGFGSYRLTGETAYNNVLSALDCGYRLVDTATFYNNFKPIGRALQSFGRENCYLTSKVWHDSLTQTGIHEDITRTLDELQTSYLDAYLIHWPNRAVPVSETLHAMQDIQSRGFIRHIGVSNFTIDHLKQALETGVSISWNQVEMHPHFYDPELLKFCSDKGIVVQAWAPLAQGRIGNDPFLHELSKKYRKTTSQIALRWITQHGCIPLPGSTNKQHIRENFEIFDFTLTENEMDRINQRAIQGPRKRITLERGLGFCDEFDIS